MAEEVVPKVEELAIAGKLTGTLEQLREKLSSLPFYSIKLDADSLTMLRVESRNIRKEPFLFYIITFRPEGISVVYSVAQDTSEKIRKVTIIRNLMSVLSIANEYYKVDETKLFQYVDSGIDELLNSLSESYSSIFNKYDALLSEYRELKRQNLELSASNRNLTIQASQLSDENKKLTAELNALKTFSDESLMAMIEDWIIAHNNSIDINDFSSNYKVPQPRVEQILDKMVSLGYIELKS
ncbi:MAG: hypothetical protein QXF41_00590 [Candidatus Micrarchaeaceae archaeon]